ncbi:COX16 (YJL003W) [Zygosaccharomyces parabailii]|uniref:Cytochrome c oxidase assembly protein COX16, mitochondrial n=1 Tax=Zygosaccharomyces bailii (strain CLIB 213 / ATCC 58445 / CBS 680 / BCRC 21525 / NBRC 1098 / NCYC 1416 / NRRL Y-2227) TaxID=1333698 RepID=A0A8J2T5I7_ZYGB2|nr:COX16 (YJL003W) [Zygosaccharomyces parabailii]CDF88368.1 BN860_08614g1_1 [Zygosaccharomyces bailii CLIB 213]CDH14750.1 probable Cytochrome c oxidase assembly protein COX16, mitochondrial [Zygosaccharomyces bailii ISA1307]SJM81989.1 probable Cytochrome c oxidase assembly protein COX16, mitochondrial [Zygosaccharomyces bailii]
MSFGSKVFRSKRQQKAYEASLAGKYQRHLNKSPFLFFGLPFCSLVVLGYYWLSGFTAVRYEQHDRKVQEMREEDVINLRTNKRPIDLKEEYYRLQGLADKDYEIRRYPRKDGESENVW